MTALVLAVLPLLAVIPVSAQRQFQQAERLGRGAVALPANSGSGRFVSWRLLGTDDASTTFDILRGGTVIASDLNSVTSYTDAKGTASSRYQVRTKVGGKVVETTEAVTPWSNIFCTLKLERPGDIYTPNDCSVSEVDGDGE